MHRARFAAIAAEESDAADNLLPVEGGCQDLFVAEAVLQGQDRCSGCDQGAGQFHQLFVGVGLEADQHQVDRADLPAVPVSPDVGKMKIPLRRDDLEALAGDGLKIPSHQEVYVVPAPLQQGAVVEPQCSGTDHSDPHSLLPVLRLTAEGWLWKQVREESALFLTKRAFCGNLVISMGEKRMFKIGDRAVYPAQGVGVVEKIESREFCGQTHDFYILRIIDNDMTIMVPVGNATQVGLRNLISKDKVETIYNVLEEKQAEALSIASWSRRQREYNDKIRTGNPQDVAEVLRELYLIKEGKELSYGEKKVLELARRLLIKELALAEGVAEEKVSQRLEKMVN